MTKSFVINGDQGLHLGHLRRPWRRGSTCCKCFCLSNVTGYAKAEKKAQFLRGLKIWMSFSVNTITVTRRFLLTSNHPLFAEQSQVQGSASRSLLCFYEPPACEPPCLPQRPAPDLCPPTTPFWCPSCPHQSQLCFV